jgi:hypothetical protein
MSSFVLFEEIYWGIQSGLYRCTPKTPALIARLLNRGKEFAKFEILRGVLLKLQMFWIFVQLFLMSVVTVRQCQLLNEPPFLRVCLLSKLIYLPEVTHIR